VHKNYSVNFGFQLLRTYLKKIRVRFASNYIAAKMKAGSQKQGPQSPTPGFLPSNSIPESIRIREDHNIIQTKKTLNPSEKG
jgi:hypothetical protein